MKKTITFSVLIITVLSVFSKLLGFLRETVVAYYFGTTHEADIFFLVFGLFTFITSAVGISLGVSFLPVFIKERSKKGDLYANRLAFRFTTQLFFFFIPILIILLIFSDNIAQMIAPSFSAEAIEKVSDYIRKLSCVGYFTIMSYVFFDILNAYKKYGIRQLTGMLFSVISIIFLLLFSDTWGIKALIYSAVIAYLLQYAIIAFIVFPGKVPLSKLNIFSFHGMRETYSSIIPVLLGTGVWYFRNAIDRVIATGLDVGSISALNYSGTLFSLINTIVIASIVTVFYTEFSHQYTEKKMEDVSKTLNKGIVSLSMILCPIMVVSIIEAKDIITILFLRGEFKQESVYLTSITFSLYLLGTPFYAMRDILTRFCYAIDEKRISVRNSIIAVLCNIPLSYVFSKYWGAGGITLASAFVSILLTGMLYFEVKRKCKFLKFEDIRFSMLKIFIATIVCAIFGCLFYYAFLEIGSPIFRFIIITVIVGITYLLLLYAFRLKELIIVSRKLHIRS